MIWRIVLAAALMAAAVTPAAAWPDRPLRMVVPYAAGGATDVIARVIAEAASARLPQRIVVENRTGAGGAIGAGTVARATDDHTVLFTNIGYAALPALYARLDFDPTRDLRAVTIVAESPMVLLVPPDSPHRTIQDFIAAAKREPGRLTYGSTGGGGALQLVSLLFMQTAGLVLTEVPYRGGAPAATDLAAGRLDMLYDAGLTGFALARGGRARALLVSSAERSPAMPEVPTVAEIGLNDAVFVVWQAVLAPRTMPDASVTTLHAALIRALADDGLRKRLAELGAERIVGNDPHLAQDFVAAEIDRWRRILARAGVQPQ